MDTLQDFTDIIKVTKFIEKYTELGINSGVRHRIANKGTNESDKQTTLRDEEIDAFDSGIAKLISDLQSLRKNLKQKK